MKKLMLAIVAVPLLMLFVASGESTETTSRSSAFCTDEEFAQQVADNEEGIEIYFFTGFCSRECMTVRGDAIYNGTTGQVYNISWNGKKGWAITDRNPDTI